jgi:hypothetical protein
MNRRVIWIVILLIVSAMILGGWWFTSHFEKISVKKPQPMDAEAIRNPYLALERFMAKMGRSVTVSSDIFKLDKLPPGGVLILDRNRSAVMTNERLDTLFNWVGKGGYLIVVPEWTNTSDPLQARLHVQNCGDEKTGVDVCFTTGINAPIQNKLPSPPVQQQIVVHIPDTERTLTIAQQGNGFKAGDIAPEWLSVLNEHSDWLLHYRYGTGNISLIANLDTIISNRMIDQYDHAEFFWTLLKRYQPSGAITLMTRLPVPSLFDWLMDKAWAASISAAVLISLWLWQAVPRFGPTLPDAPPSRRELREHLNAVGRFVWRSEGFTRWLEVARISFRERLAICHPSIAAMSPPDQAEALSRLTSRPRQLILSALVGTTNNAHEFTIMLRTIKNLKHDL